jgi:hypothetical protein
MSEDAEELKERREREELAERIKVAFAGVRRPDPPVTAGAGLLNEDVERALSGKSADDVTPTEALEIRGDLRCLTPEAFVYYLPALLRIILIGETYVDALDQFVFRMLLPPEDASEDDEFEQRVALVDATQRKTIAQYVDWYSEGESHLPGRERALAYWHR